MKRYYKQSAEEIRNMQVLAWVIAGDIAGLIVFASILYFTWGH